MFSEPNASNFGYIPAFYCAELEVILSGVVKCYDILLNNRRFVPNSENQIRDILLFDYLNCQEIRNKIGLHYTFDPEVPENQYEGRTDINVKTEKSLISVPAYYIIECKRLDNQNPKGTTGLNSKYINDGICRFVSGLYSTYNSTSAMIGFVVAPLEIHENVKVINELLLEDTHACCIKPMSYHKIKDDFDYSYLSAHKANSKEISIYHLMFDLSGNIM